MAYSRSRKSPRPGPPFVLPVSAEPVSSGRGVTPRAISRKSPGAPSAIPAVDSARSTGERALIARIRRSAGSPSAARSAGGIVRLGIGDDCAILRPSAPEELVVTTDLFLEQVHFRRDWHQPEVAGHRCLARGLSDIAAMGATPVAAFLSFALPPELAGAWARRFLDGLLRLARLHQVALAGGDTAQAPGYPASALSGSRKRSRHASTDGPNAPTISMAGYPGEQPTALFTADIVVIGRVARGKALLRSGARPGDTIYVTGSLGGAAAELALLEEHPGAYASVLRSRRGHPHLFPQPRVAAGLALRGRATAAIDVSDGLSTDLTHLCEESGVAAEIEASLIPIHPLASRHVNHALDQALHGGEDYELLFTARGRQLPEQLGGTPIHRIGRILKSAQGRPRITLLDELGARTAIRDGGWEHLR